MEEKDLKRHIEDLMRIDSVKRILQALTAGGTPHSPRELRPIEIAKKTGLEPQTVNTGLKKLKEAGLVEQTYKARKRAFYAATKRGYEVAEQYRLLTPEKIIYSYYAELPFLERIIYPSGAELPLGIWLAIETPRGPFPVAKLGKYGSVRLYSLKSPKENYKNQININVSDTQKYSIRS